MPPARRRDVETSAIILFPRRPRQAVTRLYVGNREVRLADVEPGWVFATSGPTVAPGTIVVQPTTPPRALASVAPSVAASRIDVVWVPTAHMR